MAPKLATGLPVVLIAGAPASPFASVLGDQRYTIAHAPSGAVALEWARDLHPDVILLESDLPDMPGIEVSRALREDLRVGSTVPILLLYRETMTAEQRAAALRAGVWGFVESSSSPAEVALQVDAYVQAKRNIDIAGADGVIDRATGLHSRVGMARRARELGALMMRMHGSLACIVFVFDSEPTSAGVASLVIQQTRASDTVGTVEPATVTVLAPGADKQGAAKIAERVGTSLRAAAGQGAPESVVLAGYDAAENLAYEPMDALALLGRARTAVRLGRPDTVRPWLRAFERVPNGAEPGPAPRQSPTGLVLDQARSAS